MAHQDYVARSKNKKSNPYKKKQEHTAPSSSLKIKLVAAFTIIALLTFAYFLWTIKDKKITPTESQTTTQTTPQANHPKHSAIPKFEGNNYQFRQELKHKEVQGGEYEVAEHAEYGLFCASLREYSRAETLKAQIAFTGIIAQIRTKTGSNGTWHQVLIAPYPNKRAAEADKHKLRRNKIDCYIGKWK